MCGIAGSLESFDKGFRLYESNFDRGIFSSGILAIGKEHFFLHKQEGVFNKDELENMMPGGSKKFYCFLFHSRAPTNTTAEWSYATTHPFNHSTWFAAQNGIISNHAEFPEKHEVDSELIPIHLTSKSIKDTFEAYKGLLTSWVYNTVTGEVDIIKAGSSLYKDSDSFCTISFEGSEEVPDGTIWRFDKRFEKKEDFNYHNPYFIL